jgi:DNA-binding CsgD family transcriptional regulator
MSTELVGRDAELSSIGQFVSGVSGGAVALVLEGEAGIGKTTLWRAAIAMAEERDLLVLQAQPVESEATLSFAGVGDLLDPVLDTVLDPLPAAQRRALERALVLGEDEGAPLDPRAVRVALMNALRLLADAQPVVLAIDDSQWLDHASSAGLAYGIRRYRAERIGLLLSRRSGLESLLLDELLRSPVGERFTRVSVGPLDSVALHRVINDRLDTNLPRPLLAEVEQAAGGNPFYAIEIVRTLQRRSAGIEAGQPMPVPASLHELVDERLSTLPDACRDFLLAAAAHAHPTVSITERASGVSAQEGLAPAVDAGIVELDGSRIRFTHPLLAAGAYEIATPQRRMEIHARLAESLEDVEARAWQLAACVDEPDQRVAEALEDAAGHARARGAPRPAALMLERASELTPVGSQDTAVRRAVDAAYLHFEAGDSPRAEAGLRALLERLDSGRERARATMALARVRTYVAPSEAADLFLEALPQADGDRALLAGAHEGVASCLIWLMQRLDEIVEHSQTALGLARELGDDHLAADAMISLLWAEGALGRDSAARTAEEALELEGAVRARRLLDQPGVGLVEYWSWVDEHARSLELLADMSARAEELGDEASRPYLRFLQGSVEALVGRLEEALETAREGESAAEQAGQPLLCAFNRALIALVLAQLGRGPDAEESARIAASRAPDNPYVSFLTTTALAHLDLSLNRAEVAASRLDPVVARFRRDAILEPGFGRCVPDQVEALVGIGRLDEASATLEWYEGNARRLGRISALANCARCRGSIAAQEGDLDGALDVLGQALELHEQVLLPLDRGRTLLALGAAQRRAKRRREARATLDEALAVFEEMGATRWAERARAELKRISGRAATPGALTPAEERVAGLVVEGKTNREVAAALFVSDRTVEGHLARIFGKLGIRHRSELAGALQTRGIVVPNTGDSPVSAGPSTP